ncbi:uncharacterized protein [Nicotiana sylvestris]|uniref:uncharacterized protein n=1 Tax=Nicotiana sylvestris TaxID=4096 RepID=UPI00388C5644
MNILASKREAAQEQLESAEIQLRDARKKASVQVKKIKELQSQLANLANELEAAKSKVAVAKTKADAKVAQYKVDVEAIQVHAKSMMDHAKCQARRDALEKVHDQGFDIQAELENAKVEETSARKMAFPDEDTDSLSESEGGEDPEGGDVASNEDHTT